MQTNTCRVFIIIELIMSWKLTFASSNPYFLLFIAVYMQIAFALSRLCDYCNLATVVTDGRDIKIISECDLSYFLELFRMTIWK